MIVEAARKYLGVPFVHQGRTNKGLDCAGLVVLALRDIGLDVEDLKGYGRTPNSGQLKSLLDKQFFRKKEAKTGDILLMKFRNEPQHIAIKTDIGMIHAYQGYGVVEHGMDDKWRKRIVAAYSL